MCTSASIACRATSSGVWNSGPTSTSKPRSANALAMTFWPRSWPSWPILATRIRGRRPSARSNSAAAARTRSMLSVCAGLLPVHTADRTDVPGVAAEHLLQRVGDLARRSPSPGRRRWPAPAGCPRPPPPPGAAAAAVSRSSAAWQAASSRSARSRRSFSICWARTARLSILSTSMSSSPATRYLLTPMTGWRPESIRAWVRAAASSTRIFGMPSSIALGHPAGRLDLLDVRPGAPGELVGEPLDVGAAAPRVDDPAGARLLLQQQLGVAGDPGGEVGRQRERLVERVGVQRLGVALGRGHRLDAGAGHVVEHVLRGQRPARGLAVGAQRQRLGALRLELLHQLRPEQPPGPQLRDLHEEVHADRPEERQPRRERVDVEARTRGRRAGTRRRRPACRPAPGRPSPRPPGCGSRRSRSS